MEDLLDHVLEVFRGEDLREVYPSFDAVPVTKKSSAMFTVIALESMQIEPKYPHGLTGQYTGAYPFSAVFKVSVLIPMTEPLDTAEDFFYGTAVPRMELAGNALCDALPARVDAALGRIVKEGRFRMRGLYVEGNE